MKTKDAAIRFRLPMYWRKLPYSLGFELRVITWQSENGSQRSRRLTRCEKIGDALSVSRDLLLQGARLSTDSLLEDVFWECGWEPGLSSLRNQVQELSCRPNLAPADWLGFQENRS